MNGVTPPLTLHVFMAYRRFILPSLSLATDTSVSCIVTEGVMSLKDAALLELESAEETAYVIYTEKCRWEFSYMLSLKHGGNINPYPMAFPYGKGMVLHFYQQQESSTTKTVHKVINKGLKAYV